jgi:hypothetical protein
MIKSELQIFIHDESQETLHRKLQNEQKQIASHITLNHD